MPLHVKEQSLSFFFLRENFVSRLSFRHSLFISLKNSLSQENFAGIPPEKNRIFEITPSFLFFYLSISFFLTENRSFQGFVARNVFTWCIFTKTGWTVQRLKSQLRGSKIWTGILKSVISGTGETWVKGKERKIDKEIFARKFIDP